MPRNVCRFGKLPIGCFAKQRVEMLQTAQGPRAMRPGFFSNADAMKQTNSAKWQQTLSLNNRVTRMWLNRSRHFSIIFKATPEAPSRACGALERFVMTNCKSDAHNRIE